MKFEKFLLDDYMQTKEGKKVFAFFSNLKDIYFNDRERFFKFVDSLLEIDLAEYTYEWLDPYGEELESPDQFLPTNKSNSYELVEKQIRKNFINLYSEDLRFWQHWMPFYSLLLYFKYPEYFFPYLYPSHFYKLTEICKIFDIPLMPLPGKTKHLERLNYYLELNRSIENFRKLHQLSHVELAVFFYGFAPRFISDFIIDELPEANKIFMLGASKEDVECNLNKRFQPDSVLLWQGCSEIVPGDIIVLYELTPYKRIRTIWRAISPGFDDPFHWYPGKVYVSHVIQDIPTITLDDLRKDGIWKKNGLVRSHMQGIGIKNTAITYEEYEALKKLFKKKSRSFDLSILPEPPSYAQIFNSNLNNERDVEEQLLEPFLEKLGYDVKNEFVRQFPIRMGRGFNYYPDYALHATRKNDIESADFIWEAKYRIPTKKQLLEDFGQAHSYAVRLSCKGLGLVSMEGIWLSWKDDDFSFEKLQKYSWQELKKPDIYGKIKTLFYKRCNPKK